MRENPRRAGFSAAARDANKKRATSASAEPSAPARDFVLDLGLAAHQALQRLRCPPRQAFVKRKPTSLAAKMNTLERPDPSSARNVSSVS